MCITISYQNLPMEDFSDYIDFWKLCFYSFICRGIAFTEEWTCLFLALAESDYCSYQNIEYWTRMFSFRISGQIFLPGEAEFSGVTSRWIWFVAAQFKTNKTTKQTLPPLQKKTKNPPPLKNPNHSWCLMHARVFSVGMVCGVGLFLGMGLFYLFGFFRYLDF